MIARQKKNRLFDRIGTTLLYVTAVFFLLLLASLTVYILYKGIKAVKPQFLSFSGEGIGIQLFNTIYLVAISLLISIPSGILAGIYMAEYSKPGFITNLIKTSIETLSSLPSIVVGLFGYLVLVVMTHSQWNLVAGAAAVSILNIPLITRVTEDAIRAVPNEYKEGSYSLGSTKWQTIIKLLLPTAAPSIITGIILAAGRGFGEAAALIFTSGMSSDINFHNWNPTSITSPLNPIRPADTLAVHIWALKSEGIGENADKIADLSAAVLIIMVFVFNIGSTYLGNYLDRKMMGKIKTKIRFKRRDFNKLESDTNNKIAE